MIMDYTIDRFLLERCQKKRFELGFDIIKDFVLCICIKRIGFTERWAVKNLVTSVL